MDVNDRLRQLEAKVAQLTDYMAILQLVASYGPAVDSLDRDGILALWAENGGYDFGSAPLVGREAVANLIDLETHRAYVGAGSAHTLSLPRIDIDGGRAVAVNYSQVFVKDGNGWRVERTSANRWDLVRTRGGWQVEQRTNRPLDGSQPPRDLLRRHRPNEVGAAAEPNA